MRFASDRLLKVNENVKLTFLIASYSASDGHNMFLLHVLQIT